MWPQPQQLTKVIWNIRVDVVLHEYTHDVVTAQFACITQCCTSDVALQIDVGAFANKETNRAVTCALFLEIEENKEIENEMGL